MKMKSLSVDPFTVAGCMPLVFVPVDATLAIFRRLLCAWDPVCVPLQIRILMTLWYLLIPPISIQNNLVPQLVERIRCLTSTQRAQVSPPAFHVIPEHYQESSLTVESEVSPEHCWLQPPNHKVVIILIVCLWYQEWNPVRGAPPPHAHYI